MSEIVVISSKGTFAADPLDAGVAYGFGLFETIKYHGGCLRFWASHWRRLQTSADELGLKCNFKEAAVLDAIRSLVRRDALAEGMIKLSLIRAAGGVRLLVYARPLVAAPESVTLKLETQFPLNPQSLLAGHKTHNYMENFALLERARGEGFHDAIRLDPLGHLAETTIGNLFMIKQGRLLTPSLVHGILPGTIRAAVLALFDAEQGSYYPDVLEQAEAVFMTNSGAEILPVSRVDGGGLDCFFESASHPELARIRERLAVADLEHSLEIN
jgi:branched-subunit amino acid aminotransferase/4-amino-4-deoxychorismate lyase